MNEITDEQLRYIVTGGSSRPAIGSLIDTGFGIRDVARAALDARAQLARYLGGPAPKVEISEDERATIRRRKEAADNAWTGRQFDDGFRQQLAVARDEAAYRALMLDALESVERERAHLLAVCRDMHGEKVMTVIEAARACIDFANTMHPWDANDLTRALKALDREV